MLLAMAIGVAAVVVLTGLGEAARRYVIDQFASLGTNLVIIIPGKIRDHRRHADRRFWRHHAGSDPGRRRLP